MDSTAEDSESLSWYARILVEVADTLLDSPDITQALAQAQTDPSVLRKIVIANSDDLMSASTTPELSFVERLEWELFLSRRLVRYGAPIVLFFLTLSIAGIADIKSLISVVLGAIILFILAIVIAITGSIILSGTSIIEPVGTTKDDLRRELVGPFLREQINRILAEQEHSDVMRITAAPGLADLSDREQLVVTDNMRNKLFSSLHPCHQEALASQDHAAWERQHCCDTSAILCLALRQVRVEALGAFRICVSSYRHLSNSIRGTSSCICLASFAKQ